MFNAYMTTFYRGKARSARPEVPVVNVISGLGVIDITLGRQIGVYIWYDTTTTQLTDIERIQRCR